MTEEIGKVKIDYSKYSGEDLYCDGVIEDELLKIVKSRTPAEYAAVIEEQGSWPVLYHLSPLRENIVDWVPMEAGCGETAAPADGSRALRETASAGGGRVLKEAASADGSRALKEAASADGGRALGEAAPLDSGAPGKTMLRPKVLEVGSGCGAITGALSRKAGSVTCVDLSKKRSLINAWRHRECDNVTIHVGNFKDIEPTLPRDYDYICLIGVFEYGQAYIGGDTPYEDWLRVLMSHLAPGGRILIAIENKYGLKYFAGCREDHLGTYFAGIENYPEGKGVRTFSRTGLERIFESCGADEYHFYYPYPDYKFMTMLYSDDYLPAKGELSNNLRNFDRDRMLLFDEKYAFDSILEDGLFSVFSNSYLAVIGGALDTKYVKYSNDRAPEYAIRTEITVDKSPQAGGPFRRAAKNRGDVLVVRKYPLSEAAAEHVRGMETAYERLSEKYEGSGLRVNSCRLIEDKGSLFGQFEFVRGVPLSELMDRCLERDDLEGFKGYLRQYVERIGYNSEYPAADFDLIFSNILVEPGAGSGNEVAEEDRWTLIDYEWTFGEAIDTKKLAFRAVYCYLLEDARRKKFDFSSIMQGLGITEEEAEEFKKQELEFQRFVTGNHRFMGEVRNLLGHKCHPVETILEKMNLENQRAQVQVYEDLGQGFREENSYFADDFLQEDGQELRLTLAVKKGVQNLRIDPAFTDCLVQIKELKWNGQSLDRKGRASVLTSNGTRIHRTDGFVFSTDDPNLVIALGKQSFEEANCLEICMERSFVGRETALTIENAAKKRFHL